LSYFNETWILVTDFQNNNQTLNFIKTLPLVAELFTVDGQTQTSITELIVFYCNHTKAPTNESMTNVRNEFLTEKPSKMQQYIKILLFLILSRAQHVSGDTSPIIRSIKLHKQPLVFAYVEGCRACSCWTLSGSVTRNLLRFT
jgi:hypothetical protein